MHETQREYARALGAYDAAQEKKKEAMEPFEHLLDGDDDAIEQYTVTEIGVDEDLDIEDRRDDLLKAEEDLIKWAQGVVENEPEYKKERKLLDGLFEQALRTKYNSARRQILPLCMKLAEPRKSIRRYARNRR
jgi:hypothetical protein